MVDEVMEDEAMTNNEIVFTEIISLLFNCIEFTKKQKDLKNTRHIDVCINDVKHIANIEFSLNEDFFIVGKLRSAIQKKSPNTGDIYTEIFQNVPILWTLLTNAFDDYSQRIFGYAINKADESTFLVSMSLDKDYSDKNVGGQIIRAYFR